MDRDSAPLLEAEQRLVPTAFPEPRWLDIASEGAYREAVATLGSQPVGLADLMKRKVRRQKSG